MTQLQMIEMVKQHHPHIGETEIRKLLNRAQRLLAEETGILERWFTDETTADQRLYSLDEDILEIKRVELSDEDGNYYMIPRLIDKPELGDDT